MQADMAEAQEELKDETVEATAGGGAVTVEVTGELVFKSMTIAPEAVDPDDPEMLVRPRAGRRQPGTSQAPRSWRRRSSAPPPAGSAGLAASAGLADSVVSPASQGCSDSGHQTAGVVSIGSCAAASAADHRALEAARRRRPHRPAAGVPPAARQRGGRVCAGRGDPRGQAEDRPLRDLLQPRRGPALPDLRGRAARRRPDLRRRGAGRRDLDRAHARVPRPLPRARRRAVTDRRDRSRGSEDRAALRAGAGTDARPRGRDRHQPDDHRRGDRAAHRRRHPSRSPRRCRSRGWRPGCRSAPTWSTPTS